MRDSKQGPLAKNAMAIGQDIRPEPSHEAEHYNSFLKMTAGLQLVVDQQLPVDTKHGAQAYTCLALQQVTEKT